MAEGSVAIRHIVLIQMESMRQELFPFQYGSDFHRLITATHDTPDLDHINGRLASLTPNSEILTGRKSGFVSSNGDPLRSSSKWNDTTAPTFGGLTVVGAHTTSSVSFKSTAAIHCGLWPMPVDMFEEADLTNYQPCLPQILGLFNELKEPASAADWRSYQWNRAFFQSITDEYDRQAKFNAKIGFTHVVSKSHIKKTFLDPEGLEEINYFGYAETVLKPHIRDFVINATKNEQRMFLSHFTSTTHHPWGTPSGFDTVGYMGRGHGLTQSHQDMNKYLNAVRWHDAWLGELMQLFDDLGISEETLVVFVGDHGQAFKEDCSKSGTYENSHISNFRVPIVFRHPKLPRVELSVQATSISILPTILDLLISTGSLNEKDMSAAKDLIQEYEGQSLIRSYKSESGGRRAWNFGVVNPGGRMLVVTSADTPWRLALPLLSEGEYVFTNLEEDPLETNPLKHWALEGLLSGIGRRFGKSAAKWAAEAHTVALWWVEERRRLWTVIPDADDYGSLG
ncbi:ABC transporter CDR4 [Purpureocillium lavendulum]|uniref:ABC transporter CDR4 n=1 Tax=Purpureocillium lavendulum TaxID=1247861 RepID=A0AB34FCL6_9HYPO|nr:ABC transporter CDR4 [Purpureocillium lavendulum]